MSTVTWSRRVMAAGAAALVLASAAQAQYGKPKNKPSKSPASGPEIPIVDKVEEHDWVLTVQVGVRIDQHGTDRNGMPIAQEMKFDTASVVFPMLTDTASSLSAPAMPSDGGEPGKRYSTGKLMLNDKVVDERPTFLSDYPCGTRLGKWIARDWSGQDVMLEVTLPVTSYQTVLDEDRAMAIGWPDQWPGVAASCFQPQFWIDLDPAKGPYDMKPVKDFVANATSGKNPKTQPPLVVAKVLAAEIMERIQPSGNGLNFARTGELEGIDLQGAPETIARGKGSEFDMVCALVAAYRAAGLPARTVIGFDLGNSKTTGRSFLGKRGSSDIRTWAEFALVNPKDGKEIWVPVDVVRMRKSGSRAKPVDQRWSYFGTHDELDRVAPFAFQFHPPTTVVSHGSPAFWGWLVTPKPPDRIIQTVRFTGITAPITLEDQKRKQEEARKRKEERR